MLSLFTRRVALSAYRSSATYSRILPSSALVLRDRRIQHNGHHTGTVRTFTHPQRNASTKASTKATAKTSKAKPPANSKTAGGTQSRKRLSPEQKNAKELALIAKKNARAKKEKEAIALQRERLAEKMKKLAEAKAKERKAKEAEKKLSAYDMVSCSFKVSYSAASVACPSYQASSEAHELIRAVHAGGEEKSPRGRRRLAQSL